MRSPLVLALRPGALLQKNMFVTGMAAAVATAAACPQLGMDGSLLRPERVIGTYGVAVVFLLSGLSLRLSELRKAALDVRLNVLTQFVSLGVIPAVSYPAIQLFRGVAHPKLLDGLVVTACLPTTVNMCVILTQSAGGNVAAALTNAVLGNVLGVFLTPLLLSLALGTNVDLPLRSIIGKLAVKVLVPVAVGQALRATPLLDVQNNNKQLFKRASEIVLLLIVWNAFCNAFARGIDIPVAQLAVLGMLMPLLHLIAFVSIFALFTPVFPRRDAIAGAFVASQKTLAFGLPLIKTIFPDDLAFYCAPIMLLHPSQLLVGSLLVPRFQGI